MYRRHTSLDWSEPRWERFHWCFRGPWCRGAPWQPTHTIMWRNLRTNFEVLPRVGHIRCRDVFVCFGVPFPSIKAALSLSLSLSLCVCVIHACVCVCVCCVVCCVLPRESAEQADLTGRRKSFTKNTSSLKRKQEIRGDDNTTTRVNCCWSLKLSTRCIYQELHMTPTNQ